MHSESSFLNEPPLGHTTVSFSSLTVAFLHSFGKLVSLETIVLCSHLDPIESCMQANEAVPLGVTAVKHNYNQL